MKKILLIGGKTEIGKCFIEASKKKYTVIAPAESDLNPLDFSSVDAFLARGRYDAVVHLGCYHNEPSLKAGIDNLVSFNFIEYACLYHGIRKLIVVCDALGFDGSGDMSDAREEDFESAEYCGGYGTSNGIIARLSAKDGITTLLRFFPTFGRKGKGELDRILAYAANSKDKISVKADKNQSTLYVEDGVKALCAVIDGNYPSGAYNIASPDAVRKSDIAKKVRSYLKKQGRNITLEIGEDDSELTADTSKFNDAVPNFKFTSFNSAVNKSIELLEKKRK